MTIERKLLGTTPVSGGIEPEGVSFVATDYLSKTTMTGQANSKTFTFSCWIYPSSTVSTDTVLYYLETNDRVTITYNNANSRINFGMGIAGQGNILTGHTGVGSVPKDTWSHFIMSCNMASSSQRHIYINDEIPPSLYWGTYNNFNVEFSVSGNLIAKNPYVTNAGAQRLSHLFLDYTYRALTTVSNRRLFIDADGKPSDTIPSNPILYLPMKDAATAGSNSGTGGDFTVNGVLATAERGPNQDNCSASTFDGSADYLSRSSITGIADGKALTFNSNFRMTGYGEDALFHIAANDSGGGSGLNFLLNSGSLIIRVYTTATSELARFTATDTLPIGTNHTLSLSFDLTDTGKRHVFLDGVAMAGSWSTYVNNTIDLTMGYNKVGSGGNTKFFNGSMGEVYFNTAYIDLSADNPFWDSDTNRPNSVRKVIADTGVTPLIALPIIGNDAGNNLGSGGDFTVNSGPYTGARGGSEFFARSVTCGDNQLLKGGPTPSNTHKITLALCYYHINGTTSGGDMLFSKVNLSDTGDYIKFKVSDHHQQELEIRASSTNLLTVTGGSSSNTATGWVTILISIDNASTSTRHYYVDGSNSDTSFGTYSNSSYSIDDGNLVVGGIQTGTDDFGSFLASDIAFVYFNESYIDFSQESNRNKFIDQLGYPRDLTKQISDGDIANPLVYLKMENTSALGANSGTGSNFAYKGTPVAGKDFTK